jgi:hypothetical protein
MWSPQGWYNEARAAAEAHAAHLRGMADLWLKTLDDALPELTRAEIVQRLQKEDAR